MPISTLGSLMLKITVMIVLGFILKWKKVINDETQKGISNLLLTAILPISILASSLEKIKRPEAIFLFQAVIIIMGYYIAAILLSEMISRRMTLRNGEDKLFINLSVFANVGFIGIPLITALFGAEANLYSVIYNLEYQVFLVVYAIRKFSGKSKVNLKNIFYDPMNLASIASIILFFFPVHFPEALRDSLSSIGTLVVPMSMIIIGCQISDVKLPELIKNKMALMISGLRLLLFPIIMLVILCFVHIDTTLAASMIILTALPSGSLIAILAEQYDCYPKQAALTVVESSVLMMITLPVLLLLLNIFL
jgi:predicted permease